MRTAAGVTSLLVGAALACAQSVHPDSLGSAGELAGRDAMPPLTRERIARLVSEHREEWFAYLDSSSARHARDTAHMARELVAVRRTSMTRAPYAREFYLQSFMTPAWFGSIAAREVADNMLTFQAPNGGWSKHVDFSRHPRRLGESYFGESDQWSWIATIDNGATTEEIRFLMRANAVRANERYERAILAGIDYLLASQYPNGCFPQVYPLQGGYHDAATFNDDATANVLRVLRDFVTTDAAYSTAPRRQRANDAVSRGIDCILETQVNVDGTLTAWGQQHDPLTFQPTSARSYELTSLSAKESATILDFLMSLSSPSPRVVRAVHAGVAWLRPLEIRGYRYENYELRADSKAHSLWGRMYEIGTNRVMMANRDGIKRYDLKELTDRRTGYGWYTTEPASTLATYATWSKEHP